MKRSLMEIPLVWNPFKAAWLALPPESLAASSAERLLWELDTASQPAKMSS
mgnify:CR=1 FL=1